MPKKSQSAWEWRIMLYKSNQSITCKYAKIHTIIVIIFWVFVHISVKATPVKHSEVIVKTSVTGGWEVKIVSFGSSFQSSGCFGCFSTVKIEHMWAGIRYRQVSSYCHHTTPRLLPMLFTRLHLELATVILKSKLLQMKRTRGVLFFSFKEEQEMCSFSLFTQSN